MNIVTLVGNLTRDVNFSKTQSGISYARFTVAITERYGQNEETAFISCIAWRNSADFLNKYARKGNTISIVGHIVTGSYDDKATGKKIYTTDICADKVSLIGKREEQGTTKNEVEDEFPDLAF